MTRPDLVESSETKLTHRQRKVLDHLRQVPYPISALQLSNDLFGRHPGRGGGVSGTLAALERRGLAKRESYGLWSDC